MLRSEKELRGYTIRTMDGDIGKVHEFYFDDLAWIVRYLVVDTGNWLPGRKVLLWPGVLGQPDWETRIFPVRLTKEQVESSPPISTDEPVSRQMETNLHAYYGWTPYWQGDLPPFGMGVPANIEMIARTAGEEGESEGLERNVHLRSTREVIGYQIQAQDGEIGHVTDYLLNDKEWTVGNLVVDTGNWLPGRKVLISPPWIKRINWAEKKAYVALTQESVRNSPPFDPDFLNIEEYEIQLLDHYKVWFSYLLEKDTKQGEANMYLGKDIMGNPVITVNNGLSIGKVKDLYLTADCQSVAGIYLGTEGLLSRQAFLVKSEDITTIGKDAVLVKHADVIHEEKDLTGSEKTWLRRDELQGRPVDTSGGTKVGLVGDVLIDSEGKVLGFSLGRIFVSGPIADNRSVAIHTVQDVGHEDGVMTIDLEQAEQQALNVS